MVIIYERKRQLIQFYAQHWKCGKKHSYIWTCPWILLRIICAGFTVIKYTIDHLCVCRLPHGQRLPAHWQRWVFVRRLWFLLRPEQFTGEESKCAIVHESAHQHGRGKVIVFSLITFLQDPTSTMLFFRRHIWFWIVKWNIVGLHS